MSKPKGKHTPLEVLGQWANARSLDHSAIELLRGLPPDKDTPYTFQFDYQLTRKPLCKRATRQQIDSRLIPPV